jgi:hypothetical protein
MAAPLPAWQVYRAQEYPTFSTPAAQDGDLGVSLLVCLSTTQRFTGAYRLCIFGGGELSVSVPLADVLYPLPAEFAHLSLLVEAKPDEISMQHNSVASAWTDVADMVRDGSALVVDGDDPHVELAPLVEYLADPATKKANVGASIRWAVAATAAGDLVLELQLLPAPARLLNKQNLKQDNAVSVLLKAFKLRTEMFQSGPISGPVPLLFAPDRPTAHASLHLDSTGLQMDLRTLNERFLVMEHMALADAVAYMQGRHRAAKGTPVFLANAPAAPPAKRARTLPAADSSPGSFSPYHHFNFCLTP